MNADMEKRNYATRTVKSVNEFNLVMTSFVSEN
jgi:hypothetical protein